MASTKHDDCGLVFGEKRREAITTMNRVPLEGTTHGGSGIGPDVAMITVFGDCGGSVIEWATIFGGEDDTGSKSGFQEQQYWQQRQLEEYTTYPLSSTTIMLTMMKASARAKSRITLQK